MTLSVKTPICRSCLSEIHFGEEVAIIEDDDVPYNTPKEFRGHPYHRRCAIVIVAAENGDK